MPDQIAVGVEGSRASRAAIEWSMHRAQRDGHSVVLLHATSQVADSNNETSSILNAELRRAKELWPDISTTAELHQGEPVAVLAEESSRFALVVVGTHKTGFLRGRAFGSTSVRLAASASAPLAVVPLSSGRTRAGVVVGVDDNPAGSAALRFAAREAHRTNSVLTLIHVEETPNPQLMSAARDVVHDVYPKLAMRAREVVGVAGEILTNAATSAELLVVGARPVGASLGAVGFDVLLNISGPTVVVPSEVPALTPTRR